MASNRKGTDRLGRVVAAALLLAGTGGREVRAACNVIPGTELQFAGALGTTNRAYAAPGDRVTLRLTSCDRRSPGFRDSGGVPRALVARVVFKPFGTATPKAVTVPANDVVLENDDLTIIYPGLAVPAMAVPGHTGEIRTGPAMLAVSVTAPALPDSDLETMTCAQLSARCASAPGGMCPDLVACIDELLQPAGGCPPRAVQPIFPHFTGLPPPNDYQALCTEPRCPGAPDHTCCAPTTAPLRFTVDRAGNLLVPMNWANILPSSSEPVPRLLIGETSVAAFRGQTTPIQLPGRSFVSSHAPEGGLLDPIFEPRTDPTNTGAAVLFGSADAPYTILRVARRSPAFRVCVAGDHQGRPCVTDDDCPATVRGCQQQAVCVDGQNPGDNCSADATCVGGECGAALFKFDDRLLAGVGPVVVDRETGVRGVMRAVADSFTLRAGDAAPLGGLFQSRTLAAFVVDESIDGTDRDGSPGTNSAVVTMQNRTTGAAVAIGNGAAGVPVRIVPQGAFRLPAVAVEGDVLAFLHPDLTLRAFLVDGTALTSSPQPALDAPLVNARSLVVSDEQIFVRATAGADTVLEALDATSPTAGRQPIGTLAGPSGPASVAGGAAAFLGPGDVVTLHRNRGTTDGLSCIASAAVVSGSCTGGAMPAVGCRTHDDCPQDSSCQPAWVAALVSEARPTPGEDRNGDGVPNDEVLELHAATTAAGPCSTAGFWVRATDGGGRGQAADALDAWGGVVAFTTPEDRQGETDLTDDGDHLDRVLQLYDTDRGLLIQPRDRVDVAFPEKQPRLQPAVDFVLGTGAVAFRTKEADLCQGTPADCRSPGAECRGASTRLHCDLNFDGDCCDDVLQAYDLVRDRLVNSLQAAIRCNRPACDPTRPYRLTTIRVCRGGTRDLIDCTVDSDCGSGGSCADAIGVKFITRECDQGCFLMACDGGVDDHLECTGQPSDCPGGSCEPVANCVSDYYSTCGGSGFFSDLNGNGDVSDVILQVLDVETGQIVRPKKVTTLGALDPASGERGDPVGPTFVTRGRCVLDGTSGCSATCPDGSYCDATGSFGPACVLRSPGACIRTVFFTSDCPLGSSCDDTRPAVIAPGDFDLDLVADTVDNCPFNPNSAQEDGDGDGVGDVCDASDGRAVVGAFQCYETKPRAVASPAVDLEDRFGPATAVAVERLQRLCAPADVDDQDLGAPTRPHNLAGYRVRFPFSRVLNQRVANLFGEARIDILGPDRLMVPSTAAVAAPPPVPSPSIDHFTCYRARPARGAPRPAPVSGLTVEDWIATVTEAALRPIRLCVPTDQDGQAPGAEAHADVLLCYTTGRTSFGLTFVTLRNEFGQRGADLIRRKELCVPSELLP